MARILSPILWFLLVPFLVFVFTDLSEGNMSLASLVFRLIWFPLDLGLFIGMCVSIGLVVGLMVGRAGGPGKVWMSR